MLQEKAEKVFMVLQEKFKLCKLALRIENSIAYADVYLTEENKQQGKNPVAVLILQVCSNTDAKNWTGEYPYNNIQISARVSMHLINEKAVTPYLAVFNFDCDDCLIIPISLIIPERLVCEGYSTNAKYYYEVEKSKLTFGVDRVEALVLQYLADIANESHSLLYANPEEYIAD